MSVFGWYRMIAGIDSTHNMLYLGLVIGDKNDIIRCYNEIINKFLVKEIHMSKLRRKLKFAILNSLLDCELTFLCIKVNKKLLRGAIIGRFPRAERSILFNKVDKLIRAEIKTILQEYNVREIFVDIELIRIFSEKEVNIKGEATELADIVAWGNLRISQLPRELKRKFLSKVKHIDLEKKLIKRILGSH